MIKAPEFRLPAETSVGKVALRVRDLDRSLAFYQGLLGFELFESRSDRTTLGAGGKALIELYGGATAPHSPRRFGLYHFAILLPDRPALGACLRQLIDHAVHPGASDHLVSEALYIQDPDGLGIEIYRDRPRTEWRTDGDQLAMATDPLDGEGVLQAAEGREWTGMPVGTQIGHIHLYVGDLEHARKFYHQALGLDLVVWSYPGALFMSAGGYHHHVGVNTWLGPHASLSPAGEARLLNWALMVPADAVSPAVDSLRKGGYDLTTEADGALAAADPWGTVVHLTTPV